MACASSTVLVVRPRRSAPRVRTGCTTCKVRRVKCDEGKPHCKRCTSTGRKCDGYAQSTNKTRSEALSMQRVFSARNGVPNIQLPDDNIQYLEFYHHCAGPSISSYFDKEFWSRIALQMAQSEPSIRHSLIALGYLNKTETGSLKDARLNVTKTSKQKTLLLHYNKAVNSLVQRMTEQSYSPEIGLVSCLLFICIEFMRGNYDTGWTHFNSGLRIISAFKRSQISSPTQGSGSKTIEKLLIPMFTRMMATAWMYGVPIELAMDTFFTPLEIRDRPFTSISEAELAYYDLRNMGGFFLRNIGPKLMGLIPLTEQDFKDQKHSIDAHHAWLRAFEELERTKMLSKEEKITAHVLKASYYCTYLFAVHATHMEQTELDQYLDIFKAMIKHSKFVMDAMEDAPTRPFAANFTFDMSIIGPLYFTASRCRCPVTRREALSLLERNPPREGLWDAQQHAVVARRVIELEESELDPVTGWPVERTRIWSTIINGYMDGSGRFQVYFAIGIWGEGRGLPPLPPDMKLAGSPEGRMWTEWLTCHSNGQSPRRGGSDTSGSSPSYASGSTSGNSSS